MRSEAEIREALRLVSIVHADNPNSQTIKNATTEALRYALGIDDPETCPMSEPLVGVLRDMKAEEDKCEAEEQSIQE